MSTSLARALASGLPTLGILALFTTANATPTWSAERIARGNGTVLGGTLDAGSPVWDRPRDTGSTISPTCNATATDSWNNGVSFQRHPILVSAAGLVTVAATGLAGFDTVVALYCEPSSATAPLINLVAIDDDGAGYPDARIAVSLSPGLYWVTISAYSHHVPWGGYELALTGAAFIDPPRVTELRTIDGLGQPALANGDQVDRAVTELQVGFDQEMQEGIGSDDVTNTANYLLVEAGPNGTVDTSACIGGAAATDLEQGFDWATWDPLAEKATLGLSPSSGLSAGSYRLLACGTTTLRSATGLALDGNGNGIGGDDYSIDFDITTTNLLDNPNLDSDLASWILGGNTSWSSLDSEGAPESGSARLLIDDPSSTIEQCMVIETSGLRIRGRVRAQGTADPRPLLTLSGWSAPDCSGTERTSFSWTFEPSLGPWHEFELFVVVGDASSVALKLSSSVGTAGSVFFDTLSVVSLQTLIFADDLESGGLTLWSSVKPPP